MSVRSLLNASWWRSYSKPIAWATGSHDAAILLGELADVDEKTESSGEGWFPFTGDMALTELDFSRRQFQGATEALEGLGVIETKGFGLPNRKHFRFSEISEAVFLDVFTQYKAHRKSIKNGEGRCEYVQTSLYKTYKQEGTECTNPDVQNVQTYLYRENKETTLEREKKQKQKNAKKAQQTPDQHSEPLTPLPVYKKHSSEERDSVMTEWGQDILNNPHLLITLNNRGARVTQEQAGELMQNLFDEYRGRDLPLTTRRDFCNHFYNYAPKAVAAKKAQKQKEGELTIKRDSPKPENAQPFKKIALMPPTSGGFK